jgi:hypothetical protein
MFGNQPGIRSLLITARAASVVAVSAPWPTSFAVAPAAPTAIRATRSSGRKLRASVAATRSAVRPCSRCRCCFISTPVLMPTGQASSQLPSPAQVWTAS